MSGQQRRQDVEQGTIPLRNRDAYWRTVFDKYDRDHDGKISYDELRALVESREYENEIPEHVVQKIMTFADQDGSGNLDFREFLDMIHHPQLQSVFGHLVQRYVNTMIPGRRPPVSTRPVDHVDGLYEEEYSCWPPPICMVLISLIEIALFMYDSLDQGANVTGKVANMLIYNPYRRFEVWRYFTYMFVHIGPFHLVVNLLVQLLLGVPLEMVHKWWRVMLIYLAGVAAGSLGTSVTDPTVFLAGASGGVYALVTAHIATIIMNWAQMEFAIYQLLIFLIITISDLGTAIYNRYVIAKDESIGYTAHLCGAIAGLLVGINVLRNLEVRSWEKKLWWICLILYVGCMAALIIWNVAFPNYFPPSRPGSSF